VPGAKALAKPASLTAILNRVSHSFVETGVGYQVSGMVNVNENGGKDRGLDKVDNCLSVGAHSHAPLQEILILRISNLS
jgi:hypothetical protein